MNAKVYEAKINIHEQLVQRINDAFTATGKNEKDDRVNFVRCQSCIRNGRYSF